MILYDPALQARVHARLEVETDLRWALERGELRVHFQPVVDLSTAATAGFEALLRWQHPHRGLLVAGQFIPVAEESALILEIGEWALETACRVLRGWQDRNVASAPIVMAVNLSARELQCHDLVESIVAVMERTGVQPESIQFEITETAAIQDLDAVTAKLYGLKALGVQLALDDFGTGYSSLNHLRRLPIDVVKLDRSFVTEMVSVPSTAAIVGAVTTLAHALGMIVVAEGIETEAQLVRARMLGCDRGQGWYLARAMPADALLAYPPVCDGSPIGGMVHGQGA
jgi:EAL domain-containing protein (putative c-di-GMP-specific phosphodiesterase class I)